MITIVSDKFSYFILFKTNIEYNLIDFLPMCRCVNCNMYTASPAC